MLLLPAADPAASSSCCQETNIDASGEGFDDAVRPLSDQAREVDRRLKVVAGEVKAALPTAAEPRVAEIDELMQNLGLPPLFLDLPAESRAVYGARYFVAALRRLPPDARQWLASCSTAAGLGAVHLLEHVIELEADAEFDAELGADDCRFDASCLLPPDKEKIQQFVLSALLYSSKGSSFVLAWRAAYTAAIHAFGPAV